MGFLWVFEWVQSQHSRSVPGAGSHGNKSMPGGHSVTLSAWANIVAAPVILGMLLYLGVELSLDVVGLVSEPAPKVC